MLHGAPLLVRLLQGVLPAHPGVPALDQDLPQMGRPTRGQTLRKRRGELGSRDGGISVHESIKHEVFLLAVVVCRVVWDQEVHLYESRNSGEEKAKSRGRKPVRAVGGVMKCFLFCNGGMPLKKTNFNEWMKLSEGDLNKCISIVASLHWVDLKPL